MAELLLYAGKLSLLLEKSELEPLTVAGLVDALSDQVTFDQVDRLEQPGDQLLEEVLVVYEEEGPRIL